MSARVAVTKMHGTRNDFIVMDARSRPLTTELAGLARTLCDRHTGVGADGLLVLEASTRADLRMRVINADGSEAEMCGNGIRCAVRFVDEIDPVDELRIETLGGNVEAKVLARGHAYLVRVTMPPARILEIKSRFADVIAVDVGNPHAVFFVEDLDALDLVLMGERLQSDPAFPRGVNLHVARVDSNETIAVRHYERGVGLTMACGTGAVAVAVAARAQRGTGDHVRIAVPGGQLTIDIKPDGIFMSGPAMRVFDTEVAV